MEQILYRVVESSCLPTHNIVPYTSLHDHPCHKTMKKYEDFEGMVISLLSPRNFAIQTWFCNCQQYLCLSHTVVEYIHVHMIEERCSFFQINSLIGTFHIGSMFCFFAANFILAQTCDRKCTELLLMSILSLRDLLGNQSLEKNPILHFCAVFLPHNNIVGTHVCD